MAAPTFINEGEESFATSGSILPGYPFTPPEANDIIFILVISHQPNGIGAIDTPSGFTLAAQGTYKNSSSVDQGRAALFWKRAAGGESGTVEVTRTGDTGSDTAWFAQLYIVRGCKTTGNPFDAVTARYGPGNATVTWDAVTVSGTERTLLAFCAQAGATATVDVPSTYTGNDTDLTTSGTDAELRVSYKENVSSDGSTTATGGETIGWATFHVSCTATDASGPIGTLTKTLDVLTLAANQTTPTAPVGTLNKTLGVLVSGDVVEPPVPVVVQDTQTVVRPAIRRHGALKVSRTRSVATVVGIPRVSPPGAPPPPPPPPPPDPPPQPGPKVTVTFADPLVPPNGPEDPVNPERGLYGQTGQKLRWRSTHFDSYRNAQLDDAILSTVDGYFTSARSAGVKIIFRASYNSGPIGQPDAPLSIIQDHAADLKPILAEHVDVLYCVEAGFMGAWGEWHNSTNGLETISNRQAVMDAVWDMTPLSRQILVRRPRFKHELTNQSMKYRIGHHNDCFLKSSSDAGTYDSPGPTGPTGGGAVWKPWLQADMATFPPLIMSGENCGRNPTTTDCFSSDSRINELAQFRWSSLNEEYNLELIGAGTGDWAVQGCRPMIKRRLGYRLILKRITHPQSVQKGAFASIELDVKNDGYSSPVNPRPVFLRLTLGAGGPVTDILTAIDWRTWAPGLLTTTVMPVQIPTDQAAGAYRVGLWMPDDNEGLRSNSAYTARFVNQNFNSDFLSTMTVT